MHIAHYKYCLKGGLSGKGLDHSYLKLKVVAKCGDPNILEDAMKAFPRATHLRTCDYALKGHELFGFTKHKL